PRSADAPAPRSADAPAPRSPAPGPARSPAARDGSAAARAPLSPCVRPAPASPAPGRETPSAPAGLAPPSPRAPAAPAPAAPARARRGRAGLGARPGPRRAVLASRGLGGACGVRPRDRAVGLGGPVGPFLAQPLGGGDMPFAELVVTAWPVGLAVDLVDALHE